MKQEQKGTCFCYFAHFMWI